MKWVVLYNWYNLSRQFLWIVTIFRRINTAHQKELSIFRVFENLFFGRFSMLYYEYENGIMN